MSQYSSQHSWFSWSLKGSPIWKYVQITPDETHFMKLNNNNSLLSLQLTIEYLLSVSILPKRFLYTSWQHWRSCLLLSFQLFTLIAKSVFVAQIVQAICQQFLHPAVPSASVSASQSRPCCLYVCFSNGSFSRRERGSKLAPFPFNHSW